jgi:hypothetical protein
LFRDLFDHSACANNSHRSLYSCQAVVMVGLIAGLTHAKIPLLMGLNGRVLLLARPLRSRGQAGDRIKCLPIADVNVRKDYLNRNICAILW